MAKTKVRKNELPEATDEEIPEATDEEFKEWLKLDNIEQRPFEQWRLLERVAKQVFEDHERMLYAAKMATVECKWDRQSRKYKDIWRATVEKVVKLLAVEICGRSWTP